MGKGGRDLDVLNWERKKKGFGYEPKWSKNPSKIEQRIVGLYFFLQEISQHLCQTRSSSLVLCFSPSSLLSFSAREENKSRREMHESQKPLGSVFSLDLFAKRVPHFSIFVF